jgi:hypothetical protein
LKQVICMVETTHRTHYYGQPLGLILDDYCRIRGDIAEAYAQEQLQRILPESAEFLALSRSQFLSVTVDCHVVAGGPFTPSEAATQIVALAALLPTAEFGVQAPNEG